MAMPNWPGWATAFPGQSCLIARQPVDKARLPAVRPDHIAGFWHAGRGLAPRRGKPGAGAECGCGGRHGGQRAGGAGDPGLVQPEGKAAVDSFNFLLSSVRVFCLRDFSAVPILLCKFR